ncbi:MAG TPA: WD40 repeat domain-containing protein [Bacteroidia bacterium]|nr:WD40 repeat domain-containing protein [Bacteroidia bacterium]
MEVVVELKHTFSGHDGPVYALEIGLEENRIYSGSGDRLVSEWSFDKNIEPKALINVGATVYSLCFVQAINSILIGQASGGLHVVDLEKRVEVRLLQHHSAGIFDLKYSLKHAQVYSAGADGVFGIWDMKNFTLLKSFKFCKEKLRAVALNSDESELAIACGDGFIRFIDPAELKMKDQFEAHNLSVNSVSYHPNLPLLLSGGRDAILNFWDTNNHQLVKSVPAHNYAIYSIDFSKDGRYFATASRDKTVKIWDAENLEFLLRIDKDKSNGHSHSVNKIMWTGSDMLLSAGDDKTIKFWCISKAN